MNRLHTIFFVFLLIFINYPVLGTGIVSGCNNSLTCDTAQISVRMPDSSLFTKYLSDKDYNYANDADITQELTFWLRLWRNLGKYLEKVSFLLGAIPIVFVIVIIGLVVLFLFILISKTRLYRLFYSEQNISQISFSELENDAPDADIDNLITGEIIKQNYRLAIRLMFIKLLRILETKHYIVISKGKTNFDYQSELTGTALFDDFIRSVNTYEYVWYGNYQIDKTGFDRLSGSFNTLYQQLND